MLYSFFFNLYFKTRTYTGSIELKARTSHLKQNKNKTRFSTLSSKLSARICNTRKGHCPHTLWCHTSTLQACENTNFVLCEKVAFVVQEPWTNAIACAIADCLQDDSMKSNNHLRERKEKMKKSQT